jgi:DNA invertase Pin-like site-specific DNA recombinase
MAKARKVSRTSRSGAVAIGYTRCSTLEQGRSGLGLDAQRAAIETECSRRSWTLETVLTDVASGKTTRRRPELAKALQMLERGEADIFVVSKLDRLARSLIDLAKILEVSKRQGWQLVVLDIGLDPATATGELTAHILGAVAQHERRLIADRTRAALRAKRAQGVRLGGPILLPQHVRDRVREERDAGRTLQGIADSLNTDGVATAKGGSRWYPSTVSAVLASVELDSATA